jgi:hypothetical protein
VHNKPSVTHPANPLRARLRPLRLLTDDDAGDDRQVDIATLLHADHGERELVRLDGHFHSMLTEVEDECWVYSHQLYTKLQSSGELSHPEDSFYFRTTIDTTNFRVLQGGPPGSAAAGRQAEANPDEPPKRRGRPPKRKAEE